MKHVKSSKRWLGAWRMALGAGAIPLAVAGCGEPASESPEAITGGGGMGALPPTGDTSGGGSGDTPGVASTPGTTPGGPGSAEPPGPTPPGPTPPGTTPPGNTPPGNTPPGNTPPGNTPPGNTPPGSGGGDPGPADPGPAGTAGAGVGPVPMGSCTITVTPSTSMDIATVGIVEFSADVEVASAVIEYGLDTNYGMVAPVDVAAANHRTLMLGMKPASEYHARVVVDPDGAACASADFTLSTGPRPTNLPEIEISTEDESALFGGYLINGTYQTGPAYILDKDGDFVWWWDEGEVTRARMSYDGKYMWIAKGNVPSGQAKMVRVGMDGSDRQDLSGPFEGLNHDFTVFEDGSVVFIAYGNNGCDDIKEWAADGSVRTIANTGDILGGGMCHCNAIQASREDDAIIVSELDANAYIKIGRDGTVHWVLGGGQANDFTGDGATWSRQHGLDVLGLDHLLIFNNGDMGGGGQSLAIEIQLDLDGMTATRTWEYAANPSISNPIMGDVQRLPNGNTLVTYSYQGLIHEVSPVGALLQQLSWGIGGAVGYSMKRASLYGPPPK